MNESAKWRKFLQPLVGALALLIAAATAAIQKGNSDNADVRFTALELTTTALVEQRKVDMEQRKEDLSELSAMREAISAIRSDVAFIRGKMDGSAKR